MVQGHFDESILDSVTDDARDGPVVNVIPLLDEQGTSAERDDEFNAAVEQVRTGTPFWLTDTLKQALVRNAPVDEVEQDNNELSESGACTVPGYE